MSDESSTDLVSELRQMAATGYAGWSIWAEAADEIERLRADIESLKKYTGVYSQGWQSPYARPVTTRG